jgi:FMN reductase
MSKVIIITGSPSSSSRLEGVMQHAAAFLKNEGLEVGLLRVRDLPAEDLVFARFGSGEIERAHALVAEADAVVVATPVYKAAYTGILKTYLDLLPQKGLENKIVLPIAIGGTLAHYLSIDYALRPVLTALGSQHILTGMFVLETEVDRGDDGEVTLRDEVAERLARTLRQLVEAMGVTSAK